MINYVKVGKNFMIRKATIADLDKIYEIVREAVKRMNETGNYQWNDEYPLYSDFQKDINEGTLYVSACDDEILGIICLTYEEDDHYDNIDWRLDKKAINIHRLVVNTKHRGKGISKSLFEHAEKVAIETKTYYIKGDTHYINDLVNALFIKFKYTYVGDMKIKHVDGYFKCYDKILDK